MTYGHDRVLPAESATSPSLRPQFTAWRKLDDRSRMKLVERELKPANDLIDGYPIAL